MTRSDVEPSTRRHRVLVVDDCVDTAEMMQEALSQFGYETALAHEGEVALSLAASFKPDAVLLDIDMPGMDGIEMSRQLRVEHGPRLTLIVISGFSLVRYRADAAAAGVHHYLLKPVLLDDLHELLQNTLLAVDIEG